MTWNEARSGARYIVDPELYPDVSHHRDAIEAHFTVDSQHIHKSLAQLTAKSDVVFVCFSNRSGSNLLLDGLGRIGFGCEGGDEFFNAEAVADHAKEFMFREFEQYLEFLLSIRGFRGCVFLKIGPHQLFWLANSGLLGKYFRRARYVLVERKDMIGQAVSLFIAETTGVYMKTADHPEDGPPPVEVVYSETGILKCLKHIVDVSSLFRYFFALHSLSYHPMVYEEIDADPVQALAAMAKGLAIERHFPPRWELALRGQDAGIVRQTNALNTKLIARFKEDFAVR